MNRADKIERDSLRQRELDLDAEVRALKTENDELRRQVDELKAGRRPTDAVSTKTLRIADKP